MQLLGVRQVAAFVRRSPRVRSWRFWFVLGCLVAVAAEIDLLFLERSTEFAGRKPTLVTELGDGVTIRQDFVAPDDGLDALTVWTAATGRGSAAARVLARLLREEVDGFVPVYASVMKVELTPGARTFVFPPEARSQGRTFRLELQVVDPIPVRGLELQAFADGGINPGLLTVGNHQRWSDLRLTVHAASRYRVLRAQLTMLPGWARSPVLHVVLLAVYTWALMTFLYSMIRLEDRESLLRGPVREPAAVESPR
jgi:hypothetical protein